MKENTFYNERKMCGKYFTVHNILLSCLYHIILVVQIFRKFKKIIGMENI